MARVDVSLNGRTYALACEDGQEPRLMELVEYLDARLREIAGDTTGGTEAQLLVLSALVLADEVFDLQAEVQSLRLKLAHQTADAAASRSGLAQAAALADQERAAQAVDLLARRIEDIAARLERA